MRDKILINSTKLCITISFLIIISLLISGCSGRVGNLGGNTNRDSAASEKEIQPQDSIIQEEPVPAQKKKTSIPQISSECLPSKYPQFSWEVIKDNQVLNEYEKDYELSFQSPEEYSDVPGVTTFRGNNFRNSASYGYATVKEEKLEKVWFSKTGYIDIWTGVGWNG